MSIRIARFLISVSNIAENAEPSASTRCTTRVIVMELTMLGVNATCFGGKEKTRPSVVKINNDPLAWTYVSSMYI